MTIDWDAQIGSFLGRLSRTQHDLLSLLAEKRMLLEARDYTGLQRLVDREQALATELQGCHQQRLHLLAEAEAAGLPGNSVAELDAALPRNAPSDHGEAIQAAQQRAELARHACLSQWVAIQRTLLHLSQMLEIIATGGRPKPTYGDSRSGQPSGALMDQAV